MVFVNCFAVGAGGFIGSVFRYLIGFLPFFHRSNFPFQTLFPNVLGAVLIGVIMQSASVYGALSGPVLLFLKVGICGGFTTFSTFSLESVGFLEDGKIGIFFLYTILSLVLCMAGVFLGKMLVHH